MNEIIRIIKRNFSNYSSSIVLKFDSKEYTYQELKLRITTIVKLLNDNQFEGQNIIGFDATETSCFETYSQIFACFFAGKCFVPINFNYPKERIEFIVNTTQIKTILINDSSNLETFKNNDVNLTFINTNSLLNPDDFEIINKDIDENALAYILFTSGSTGIPKGVPLTRKNLLGFADNFLKLNYHITPADSFLQMFDFTFDLSIFSYFIPLLYGASIHPISSKGIKLSNTFNTMMDNKVTVALVVPSLLSFLKPYYEEIELSHLRYLFFCGEALSNELTFQFSKCIPNARIVNFYGPTEATIFCTYYEWKKELMHLKHHNGAVSIGKSFPNMLTIILDDNNNIVTQPDITGELCLAGNQLTPGYFKNDDKNKTAFTDIEIDGVYHRFYRTGDLAFYDKDGDIMFCGRKDFQVKIQGYRIELGEIEHTLRKLLNNQDVVVVAKTNKNDIIELHAFIRGPEINQLELKNMISEALPAYMIPATYNFIDDFPLNNNGKIDRNKLRDLL